MKILVYLGHPAHFYLYKNAIINWRQHGHRVEILIKKKDILQQLLDNQGWEYHNILAEGRKSNKIGMALGVLKRAIRQAQFCISFKPHIMTGTSVENSIIGPLSGIPVVNCNEDDAAVVPLYAKLSYPGANAILNPFVCNSGKWDNKATKYPSYQELAYLHPNHFTPNKSIVEGYGINTDKPYFVMRFASLKAHHDDGVNGINTDIAQRLVDTLSPHGQIYITSERELEPQFEPYRIRINPLDMHHVMAFASLYIGDSQTMAAEAGVLGTPFVRFNDFVGRLSYIHELEYPTDYTPRKDGYVPFVDKHVPDDVHYCLGYGHKTADVEGFYRSIEKWMAEPNRKEICAERRERMLSEKIDYAKYLTWFIENYPASQQETRENQENAAFWAQFK
jgi:predicted glycosyltransferase